MKLTVDFTDTRKPVYFPKEQKTFALALIIDAQTPLVRVTRDMCRMSIQSYVDTYLFGPEELRQEFEELVNQIRGE